MRDNILLLITYGSHLYGTNTPSSDHDTKGIFLPSKEEVLLGKIPKSVSYNFKINSNEKNNLEDFDIELYSLQYFMELACKGETVALDMLHAPEECIEYTHKHGKELWDDIRKLKPYLYTKNLKAFLGYCRKQASKYGIKGSRLSDAQNVLSFLDKKRTELLLHSDIKEIASVKMRDFWEELPEGEHIFKLIDDKGIKMYEVCGRKIQETSSIRYAYEIIEKFYNAYGERARQAKNNENIDWKAMSHAIRVALEMKEIYEYGTITFPLSQADYLKDVKAGLLDYTTEVAPFLEKLVEEVEELSQKSNYPEKVDREYIDNILVDIIEYFIFIK